VADDVTPEYCACETLVLGCGNELFGDDGFGPAVARRLRHRAEFPETLLALDVGTSVREVLFNVVLSPVRPRRIVVVDAVDLGRPPGDVWTLSADELPEIKCDDFSMHQLPTSNLLRELSQLGGVNVTCVVGQVDGLPSEVRPGLSAAMEHAVDRAVELILNAELPIANCQLPTEAGGASGMPALQSAMGNRKSATPQRS
jgi:coenzyme F420 hydrogenase subunit delta